MGYLTDFKKNKTLAPNILRRRLLLCLIFGTSCLLLLILSFLKDPILMIATYQCRVEYGGYVHKALTTEYDGVHVSTYLFNVTNAQDFQDGLEDKLRVEEVGPFTYQELRLNELLEIIKDDSDHILKYTPRVTTKFIPEDSVGNPEKINVTMPNIALLTMLSKMSSYSFIPRAAFNMIANQLNSKAIVNMNVQDYLWGYDEPLIKLGNSLLPGMINFDTLGVMDRLYDKKAKLTFEVSGKEEDKFAVRTVNGVPGLDVWGYDDVEKRTPCNTFTDAFEGYGYPPGLTPDSSIRIYRATFCRILDLKFNSVKETAYGTKGLDYKISDDAYSINNATECYCNQGICHEGVSDLSPCFLGLPVVLSNAHFLGADPKLYERIEGMTPDQENHGSSFVIDPKVGMAVETKFSVQLNIKIEDVNYNSEASKFSNMIIPVAYFKIVQPTLVEKQQQDLKLLYVIGPVVLQVTQIILLVVGLVLLSYSALIFYWNWLCSKRKEVDTKNNGKRSVETPLVNLFRK